MDQLLMEQKELRKNSGGSLLVLLIVSCTALAQDINECVSPNGKKVYSDLPCPKGSEQWTVVTQRTTVVDGLSTDKRSVLVNKNRTRS